MQKVHGEEISCIQNSGANMINFFGLEIEISHPNIVRIFLNLLWPLSNFVASGNNKSIIAFLLRISKPRNTSNEIDTLKYSVMSQFNCYKANDGLK